jgi:hypothetical protein
LCLVAGLSSLFSVNDLKTGIRGLPSWSALSSMVSLLPQYQTLTNPNPHGNNRLALATSGRNARTSRRQATKTEREIRS